MTTVAQLIEYLKTLPQDANVRVMTEIMDIHGTRTEFRNLDISNIGNVDYAGAPWNILDFGGKE